MSTSKVITAIYENGVLRPLEKVDLPENTLFRLTIEPVEEEERQETLADVLGFDPDDEEKYRELAESQYRAIQQIIGLGNSGLGDVSENHDKYLYRVDWE